MLNIRTSINPSAYKEIKTEFPAHLHINLLPEYQRFGLGTLLIQYFEDHMRNLGVAGIHLKTTNYNKRAVPFYLKSGYKIVNEVPMSHFKFPDLRLLTFAKKIFYKRLFSPSKN
jgi:GNAT superfamily N-acetyltransferase